jgi:gliding motility-associated lipoprotein GldD
MYKFFFIVLICFTLGFTACNSKFTPKETGYPALTLPKKTYLQFPTLNATLYISYNAIQKNQLDVLVRDAYNFANNHSNKASFIEDSAFENPLGLQGVFFHLGGDVASPYQFFITDSSRHFLRGALYFDTTPNADSLAPVIDFLYQDLKQLVKTFHWKS